MRQLDVEIIFEDDKDPYFKLEDGTTLNVVRWTSVDHRDDPSTVAEALVKLIVQTDDGLSTALQEGEELVELLLGDDGYHWAVLGDEEG